MCIMYILCILCVFVCIYLYSKYCLSVRYENGCNEKRGRYLLIRPPPNNGNGKNPATNDYEKSTWMEEVSRLYILNVCLCVCAECTIGLCESGEHTAA